jgi:FkbM family methyltransferase
MSLVSRTASRANRLIIRAASLGIVRRAARSLFGLLTPGHDIKVAFPGYSLYVRTPDRLIAALLCKYSFDSSLEVEIYRSRVKPGMTVVEIGANVGFYTLLFSGLAGKKGRVLAFEPDPGNFRLLERSAAENKAGNISCRQAAVSDKSGKVKLFISEENRGDHRIYDCGEGRGCVEVEAVSIDGALGPEARADFIKMDIQGAEYLALLGMAGTIKNSPELSMLCEFSPDLLRKCGASPEALLQKLLDYGFSLNYLDERARSIKSASPAELLALCPGDKYLNLLLEKKAGPAGQI